MDYLCIYHTIFIDMDDISIYHYLALESLFNLNIDKLYLHYYDIPKGNLWNKIYDKYGSKINFVYIHVPIKLFNIYKKSIIFKILYDFGGIYFDEKILFINNFNKTNYDINKIYSTSNYDIIISSKNNKITYYLFQLFFKNNLINFIDNNNNIELIEYNYDNNIKNLKYIIDFEIKDYTFSQYFHIFNNCSFFCYNILSDINININNIFKNITVFNLLVRSIIAQKYINNLVLIDNLSLKNNLQLINNIDKIYWINLNESIDRKVNMENIFKKINIINERIEAVDGTLIDNINFNYFYNKNNNYPLFTNKEYAILLSHLNAIEKYIYDDSTFYNFALICEDDLSLDFISYWKNDFKTIIEELPHDCDILMLGYFSLNLDYKKLYNEWNNEWSAICYLVNKNNIKNKINNLKYNNKWICNDNDLMVADNYIFSKFKTYVYKYPYFTFPNNNNSTLHDDHIQYHNLYKLCNYLVLENLI